MQILVNSSRMGKKLSKSILLGSVGAILPFSAAQAQSADEADAVENDDSVIIVTARKRDERLQDSPVVISALSEKTLDDFAIESVEDISDFTPGLVADSQGNPAGGVLFLRGVGSGSGSPSIDQAVALVLDDMQMGSLLVQQSALVDMESVQVYKGPQALFFGKNSPGGVLAIRTADPKDEFEGQVKGGYDFGTREWFTQGLVSGPITDNLKGRLVARYSDSDGYFDVQTGTFPDVWGGQVAGKESIFVRGTVLWEPSEDWTVRGKLTYNEENGEADGRIQIQRVFCPLGAPQGSPPHECEADNTVQATPNPQGVADVFAASGFSNIPSSGIVDREHLIGTVAIDFDNDGPISVSSVTGYYKVESTTTAPTSFSLAPNIVASLQDFEFEQFTQELRFSSNLDGPVNFTTGLFYESKQHDSDTVVPINALVFGGPNVFVLGGRAPYVQDTSAMSAFGEVIIDFTDSLELSAGARYSYEQKTFNGTGNLMATNEKLDFNDVSPQVTLSYKPNDDWLVFGSYRQGFKSGGFDGAFSFAPIPVVTFNPETVDGFEVGAKGTLADGDLQVSLAAFMYDYADLQLSFFNAATLSLQTGNATSAEINGVEMDFVWNTRVDGLQVRGAFAYLDATFAEYAAPCFGGQSIAQGCDGNLNPGTGAFTTQDRSGGSLPLAAEFIATLGMAYEQDLGGVVMGLSADGTYNSGYVSGVTDTPGTRQDSFAMFNASVSISSPDDTWSLAVIGRNLTNEFTVTNGGTAPFGGVGTGTAGAILGDSIAFVRPGRTVAVEATFNF